MLAWKAFARSRGAAGRKATESLDVRSPMALDASHVGNSSGMLARCSVWCRQGPAWCWCHHRAGVAGAVLALQPCRGETPVTIF